MSALRTDRVRLNDDVAKRDQTTARLVYCCLVMVTTSSTWSARLRQAAMVTAFSLSRRLDAYYAVKEAYSEYRGDVDDAAFAVSEELIVEVLTNLSALREGYLKPELDWATLQAMCLYHLYGSNAQMYGGNTQMYGGNAQLYGGNAQLYGGSTQLYSGNAQLYGGNAQLHTKGIVLEHRDASYTVVNLVNTAQGGHQLRPGILQHLLTSGRNNKQVLEGQQGVGRQEVVSTTSTSATDDCFACELPAQNARPVKISFVDVTQNKASSTKLNQSVVPAESVSPAVVPTETMNPTVIPAETISHAMVPAETVSSSIVPVESINPPVIPTESDSLATVPTETVSPAIIPPESASPASKNDTPNIRVIKDYQASYIAYVGKTKCTSLDSLPPVTGPVESWEVHVPESFHWRRRKGSKFGAVKREPTHLKSKNEPHQPTHHATKRPSKPKITAHPMITRTCRRSKHAIDKNAEFPYQMELDTKNGEVVESRHKCGVCSAICETRLLVVKHLWETHNIHLRRLRGYDKAVVCNICSQVYVQRKCMLKHMREHSRVAGNASPSKTCESHDCSDDAGLETHFINAHKLISVVAESS